MKAVKIILMSLLLMGSAQLLNPTSASAQASVSFQFFYDELSPYGNWVDYPQYGYVWVPTAGPGFVPYSTGGHWVFTDFGWTWVSDFGWGWAPFHYGRWFFDDFYGWLWLPGYEWGPAWVCWRHAPGFYGWTPLAPGISLQVAFGPRWNVPHDRWVFVNERFINSPRLTSYIAPRTQNVMIIQKSTVINNTYADNSHHTTYVSGPRKDDVQRITGSEVKPIAIKENSKPGQTLNNNELRIYRPAVQKSDASASKPAPKKISPLKEMQSDKIKNGSAEQMQKSSAPQKAPAQPQDIKRNNNNTVKESQPPPKPASKPAKKISEPVKQPNDIRNDQHPERPVNTIDRSHQRPDNHQRSVSPVRQHDRPKSE